MLPDRYRLRRSRDFARVRRSRRWAKSPAASLYALSTHTPEIRIGFSVSKRVGNAAVRNRVKRVLREAVRFELPHIREGQDLVFIARPSAAGATLKQASDTVGQLLKRAGALKPPGESTDNA